MLVILERDLWEQEVACSNQVAPIHNQLLYEGLCQDRREPFLVCDLEHDPNVTHGVKG